MIDIKFLLTIKTIFETDSLIESSKILNLTLSAISHQVKQVESYYQCKLFVRKTKPLEFTREGKVLLDLADRVLPEFHQAERQIKHQQSTITTGFNIAVECHSCYKWIIPTLRYFNLYWPQVETDLLTGFNFDPLPQLLSSKVDVVITADPVFHVDIEYIPLFDFEMMAGVSNKHALAKKSNLSPQDLIKETLITYPVQECKISIINRFLKPAGIKPYKTRSTELTIMAVELAAINQGICFLPNWAFAEYDKTNPLKLLRIGDKGLTETLYIACREDKANNNTIKDFIRFAKINCLKYLAGISIHDDK